MQKMFPPTENPMKRYTGFNDQFIDVSVSNNKLAKMKITIFYDRK